MHYFHYPDFLMHYSNALLVMHYSKGLYTACFRGMVLTFSGQDGSDGIHKVFVKGVLFLKIEISEIAT